MRVLNLEEYLPTEEIHSLKQVFYLVMMALFIIDTFYQLTFNTNYIIYFLVFDLALCLFTITILKTDTIKSYVLAFSLIPFDIITYIIDESLGFFSFFEIIHFLALIYMVWFFYKKFKKYTKTYELGYTILLLYGIIFVSFICTTFVEHVNLLDSLVMVSNAFTSNGYAILGSTIAGKLNSLFLVWSGYILSGVGTATLTFAITKRYYEKKFDKIEKYDEKLDEIEKLIKELKDDKK